MTRKSKIERPERISGGYASIPWVVMDSASFKGSTEKAKALLLALMRQHNGANNGHLHLAKQWLYDQGWTCHENNSKARNELIERGLIIQTKWGGLNMGPDLFALTWHNISNYVGLDISAKSYIRGAYALCNLPRTKRRKPPVKKASQKQKMLPDSCPSSVPVIGTVECLTDTTTVPVISLLDASTGTTTENNVVIPLPALKTLNNTNEIKIETDVLKHTPNNVSKLKVRA